jgi:hypothetical protein
MLQFLYENIMYFVVFIRLLNYYLKKKISE